MSTDFPLPRYRAQLLAVIVGVITLLSLTNTFAQTNEPINIEADKATLNEKLGKSVYTGNVVLTQGGIRVSAEMITVLSQAGKLSRITATGNPVTYQQHSLKNDITAEARQLNYFANEERIVLLDNAKLSQGRNSFSGNQIEYHTRTEVVTAAVSEQGSQRVQVTIHPEMQTTPPATVTPIITPETAQ